MRPIYLEGNDETEIGSVAAYHRNFDICSPIAQAKPECKPLEDQPVQITEAWLSKRYQADLGDISGEIFFGGGGVSPMVLYRQYTT